MTISAVTCLSISILFHWRDLRAKNPGRPSTRLLIRTTVVRRSEPGEVPAEVQFEVARNTVTDVADLRTARLRTGQGKQREEQVIARLELGSCRHPEPINLGLCSGKGLMIE